MTLLRKGGLLVCLGSSVALRLEPTAPEEPAGSCTSGKFGSTEYLEGVQTMDASTSPLAFKNFMTRKMNGNLQGLFVYPEKNFAMCTMEKNGCNEWLTILERLRQNNASVALPYYGVVKKAWSEKAANAIFQNPQSLRVLWVRDPLERFLSAFLNKCVATGNQEFKWNCPFKEKGTVPGFPMRVVQAFFRNGNTTDNGHFTPQSTHCQLDKRMQEYNLIGLMSHRDSAKNAACILKQAGLSDLNKEADGQPTFKEPAGVEEHEAKSRMVLKKMFTKEFAQEMLEFYKSDYELFRLKRPTWVDEATGEWFNKYMHATRSFGKVISSDEDDIVQLAADVGFSVDEA